MKPQYFRIKKFKHFTKKERGVIYFFGGFGSPLSIYIPAITRFRKHGFSVVSFKFKTKAILGLSIESLPQLIDEVSDTVAEIEKNREIQVPSIVIGNSMGSVFAWHTASRIPSISKIVANTGYALISKHIFEDKIGMSWRKTLIADGINENAFHKLIQSYEPISVFDKLHGKDILIFLNRDDNVISFSNSILYNKTLDKYNISYEYVESSKMRHGTTIIRNLLSKRIVNFIERVN